VYGHDEAFQLVQIQRRAARFELDHASPARESACGQGDGGTAERPGEVIE